MMEGFVLSVDGVRDLAPDVLDESGQPRVMPAAFYDGTTIQERGWFGNRHGIYCFPTTELVNWLTTIINGRSAIEIGSGNGVLAAALGIPATDNRMQEDPAMRAIYASQGQPVVNYGKHVEKLDARAAVRKYRPQVVVATWVTHKYDEKYHDLGGNMFGVDEMDVLANCEQYVFVGNTQVHSKKPLWRKKEPALIETPDWLYSRALNGSPDFVAVWNGKRR